MPTTYLTESDRVDLRGARANLAALLDKAGQPTLKNAASAVMKKIDSILSIGKISSLDKSDLMQSLDKMQSLVNAESGESSEERLRNASMRFSSQEIAIRNGFKAAYGTSVPLHKLAEFQAANPVKK